MLRFLDKVCFTYFDLDPNWANTLFFVQNSDREDQDDIWMI